MIKKELEIEYLKMLFMKVECAICHSRVSLETIEKQYTTEFPGAWRTLHRLSEKPICGFCAHEVYDEHDKCPENMQSITCRCGNSIYNEKYHAKTRKI